MTRKQRRLTLVLACGAGLAAATGLTLSAFKQNIVFFMAPTDIAANPPSPDRVIRLGGMVENHSLTKTTIDGTPTAIFRITDGKSDIKVSYAGILPDLFREGQGVVTLGTVTADHQFVAQEVLAKHDENYMPKDVVDALKRTGHWQENAAAAPPGGRFTAPAATPGS